MPYSHISSIYNSSLESGVVQQSLKAAVISPTIKKPRLDRKVLKNYRPISTLPFLSKVLERVVAKQLSSYMSTNSLHDFMQTAYKSFHGTETALIKVHDDIICSMDRQRIRLVLLDLRASFDTRASCLDLGINGVPLAYPYR